MSVDPTRSKLIKWLVLNECSFTVGREATCLTVLTSPLGLELDGRPSWTGKG